MKCPKCGGEVKSGAKFCPQCGASMDQASTGREEAAAVSEPNAPVGEPATDDMVELNTDTAAPEPKAGPSAHEPATESAADSAAQSKPVKLSKKAKIILAAMAVIVIVGAGVAYVLSAQHQQLVAAVEPQLAKALSKKYDGEDTLFAKNDYVEPTEYESSLDEVSSISVSNGKATGSVQATFDNESFESKAKLNFTADADDSNKLSHIKFSVESQTTTPIAGIDYDEENDLENCDSELTDDNECTVSTPSDPDTPWYANSKSNDVYSYSFDGKKWSFDDMSTEDSDTDDYYNYDAITGTYQCTMDDKYACDDPITITDVDSGAGKVYVDIHLPFHNEVTGEDGELNVTDYEASITWLSDDVVGFNVGTKDDDGNYIFMVVVFNPNVDGALSIYRGTTKGTDVTGIKGYLDSETVAATDSYIDPAGIFPLGRSVAPGDVPYPMFAHD